MILTPLEILMIPGTLLAVIGAWASWRVWKEEHPHTTGRHHPPAE